MATKLGSECVAYTVSKGYEDRREAVFLINGNSQGFADAADYEASARSARSRCTDPCRSSPTRCTCATSTLRASACGDRQATPEASSRRSAKRIILGATVTLLKQRLGIKLLRSRVSAPVDHRRLAAVAAPARRRSARPWHLRASSS